MESFSHQHKVWLDSFEKEAIHALREMCAAPHRRDDPKCKELVRTAEKHHRHILTQSCRSTMMLCMHKQSRMQHSMPPGSTSSKTMPQPFA